MPVHSRHRPLCFCAVDRGVIDMDLFTRDFYATPPECTEALINALPDMFTNKIIWEPACGNGAISGVFLRRGFSVQSTDLHIQDLANPDMIF